jgi:hypothetical protein
MEAHVEHRAIFVTESIPEYVGSTHHLETRLAKDGMSLVTY